MNSCNVLCGFLLMITSSLAIAQEKADMDKFVSVQGTSSPLVYKTTGKKIPDINPESFYDDKECTLRSGMPNFYTKIANKEAVTVAFIGGSITQGDYCYRLQITKHMEGKYPGIRFKWVNAGVSGTGTDLGSCRIQEQVLQYAPDLVFVEFAVNGGYSGGMEGMIRKIITNNPYTDICLIYSIARDEKTSYQNGTVTPVIERLESMAEHYQLPSIHMGMEAAQLDKENRLLWKGTPEEANGRILFSSDAIHPIAAGGCLYAAALARGMEKIKKGENKPFAHTLPAPLFTAEWETAGMYLPSDIASFDKHWKEIRTREAPYLKRFSEWFNTVMTSSKEGSSFTFRFEGDMFGLFDIGGPEVGQIECIVDGKTLDFKRVSVRGANIWETNRESENYTLNRFNVHCNNRYRGQYDLVKLEHGVHEVVVRISSEKADKKTILGKNQQEDITQNPGKYDQSVLYLGRILLRGKPL